MIKKDKRMKKLFALFFCINASLGMQNDIEKQDNLQLYRTLFHFEGSLKVNQILSCSYGFVNWASISAGHIDVGGDFVNNKDAQCHAFSITTAKDCDKFFSPGSLTVDHKLTIANPHTPIVFSPYALNIASLVKNGIYMGRIYSCMGENGWGTIKVLDYENASFWEGIPTYEFDGKLAQLETALSEGITEAGSLAEFVDYLKIHLVPPQPKPTIVQRLTAWIGL